MSNTDKKTTFQHFRENVWIKTFASTKKEHMQLVNICIQLDDKTFANIGALHFSNGIYYSKNDSLGTIDDIAFLNYIEKISGLKTNHANAGKSVSDENKSILSVEEICAVYRETQSIRKTCKRAGLSEEKTKKILIAEGLYTSDKFEQIKALLKQGQTFDEIAVELKISQKQLRVFVPNDKAIKNIVGN